VFAFFKCRINYKRFAFALLMLIFNLRQSFCFCFDNIKKLLKILCLLSFFFKCLKLIKVLLLIYYYNKFSSTNFFMLSSLSVFTWRLFSFHFDSKTFRYRRFDIKNFWILLTSLAWDPSRRNHPDSREHD